MPPAKIDSMRTVLLACVLLLILVAALFILRPGAASAPGSPALPLARPPLPAVASAPHALPAAQPGPPAEAFACRECHDGNEATITFPEGGTLSVDVDPAVIDASVHGDELNCTSCHPPASYQFPHPPVEADSLREYEIARSLTCERCHQDPHITNHPGRESDNPVVCTDCHGAHDVHAAEEWTDAQSLAVCADCHVEREVDFTSVERLQYVVENNMFAERPDNDYCLSCHSLPDLSMTLNSGDELLLNIDEALYHESVHGVGNEWQLLACVDCHEGYVFPHDPVLAETLREYTLEKQIVCVECHESKAEEAADGVHAAALERGIEEAAVCTDCHGAHYVPPPDEPRTRISQTYRQCHSNIFDEYAESVHGEALLEEGNPDVAVCTDCHGVHEIVDPDLAAFRVSSPQLCGECHADEALMEQYDISTEVFDTYVADFHGTTVTLFDIQDPDAETNKAVCYDCHGVHDIRSPDDPNAGIKQNLLDTCQQCHPNASANFPDSWLSHYRPSLEHHPAVFLVETFYNIIIPATVGFLLFLVGTDVYRRVRRR